MLPLLLDRSLFLRCVLRLLLAFLRGLMGHGSLLCSADAMAPQHYRPSATTWRSLTGSRVLASSYELAREEQCAAAQQMPDDDRRPRLLRVRAEKPFFSTRPGASGANWAN